MQCVSENIVSCVSDCQAATAVDPAAAQDKPASAADSGQLLSRPSDALTYTNTASSILPYVIIISYLCLRMPMLELLCKLDLFCLVPAGEHALRDDPGFPPQHPAPLGHL